MSIISRIDVATHCNDLGGRVWNPVIRWHQKYAVFVVVEDDEGRRGFGECWCFDSAPDALVAFLRSEVAPHFLDHSTDDLEETASDLTAHATLTGRHGILASALSGMDIAIRDLRSRVHDVPLWRDLAPAGSGSIRLYASGGLYGEDKSKDDLAAEVASMASDGFDLVKIKVGGLAIADDVRRVISALSALPDGAQLIIDGVYSYGVDTALRLYYMLPAERIEAFQSPLPAADIAGMAQLCRAGIPVMATEAEYRDELHRRLIGEGAVTFLQTAPVACGGIGRVLALADLVRDTPIRLSLEVSSTAVALMAAAHLAAAEDTIAHVERHYVHQVFYDRLAFRPSPDRPGLFDLPRKPGLGIDLPYDATVPAWTLTRSSPNREPGKAATP